MQPLFLTLALTITPLAQAAFAQDPAPVSNIGQVRQFSIPSDGINPERIGIWFFLTETGGNMIEVLPDGSLYSVSPFEDEAKHGTETAFFPDGTIFRVWNFVAGNAQGNMVESFANGVTSMEVALIDGIHHGPITRNYPNGSVAQSGTLVHGLRHGTFKTFLPNGRLMATETWWNGQSQGQNIIHEPSPTEYAAYQEAAAGQDNLSQTRAWKVYLNAIAQSPAGVWPRLAGLAALGGVQAGTINWDFGRMDADSDGRLSHTERTDFGIPATDDMEPWGPEELRDYCRASLSRIPGARWFAAE